MEYREVNARTIPDSYPLSQITETLDKLSSAYLEDKITGTPDPKGAPAEVEGSVPGHRKAGIRLNPTKTSLFKDSEEYLGHHVSAQGIRMIQAYIQRILDWPRPNVAELQRLLGFVNYYRSFIVNFS